MAIFNSYVKLPEGTWNLVWDFSGEQIQGSRVPGFSRNGTVTITRGYVN